MLNESKVKKFWQQRGEMRNVEMIQSIVNLQPDVKLCKERIHLERQLFLPKLNLSANLDVLDLGGGYGQWAFEVAPMVNSVTVVDFSSTLIELGKTEQQKRRINNIDFIECAAEKFLTDKKFDIVMIFGLFVSINDCYIENIARNVFSFLKPGGTLFLRESICTNADNYIIDDRFSEALQTNYSAIYRNTNIYIDLFTKVGLTCTEHAHTFSDGSLLNKWSNTRLHYFVFTKNNEV